MRDNNTSQHAHDNLAEIDTRDYHLEQPLQEICSKEKYMKYLRICLVYLALLMIFWLLVMKEMVNGKDHDDTLYRVLQICRQVNLKLNKDKCHFRCMQVLFFGKIISRHGLKCNPRKLKEMKEIPPPKNQKRTPSILWNNKLSQ